MTSATMNSDAATRGENPHKTPIRRVILQAFLIFMAIVWLFPIAYAIYTSFRPYGETNRLGYVSIGGTYNLDNYVNAWDRAELPHYFLNTVIIVVPAVILVLLLASMAAFVMFSSWGRSQGAINAAKPHPLWTGARRELPLPSTGRGPGCMPSN